MEIGQKLKNARSVSGLTQESVAESIGVSRQTISNWENNRSYPDVASVLKLSDLYSISLDELLKEDVNMRKNLEDNTQLLRKYWNLLYDSAFVLVPLSVLFGSLEWSTAALVLRILALIVSIVPRLIYMKYFGGTWKHLILNCLGWGMYILGIQAEAWWGSSILESFATSTGLLLVIVVRYMEYSAGERKSPPWVLFGLQFVSFFVMCFSLFFNVGDMHEVNPFNHDYHVAEVLYGETAMEDLPVVYLGKDNLQLSFDQHTRSESETIGEFVYVELAEGQQAEGLKGLWQLVPENDANELYRLTVENDDSVVLAHLVDDQLQWKYRLSRVDFFVADLFMEKGLSGTFPDWYYEGEFTYQEYQLAGPDVDETCTLNIMDRSETLSSITLIEEYYTDGEVEIREYQLTKDQKGAFSIQVGPRRESGGQYAVYRIPYEGGEFIFTLYFG